MMLRMRTASLSRTMTHHQCQRKCGFEGLFGGPTKHPSEIENSTGCYTCFIGVGVRNAIMARATMTSIELGKRMTNWIRISKQC